MANPVLVTGAAGFIGMHVARRLLADGREVLGLDDLNAYYDPRLKERRVAEIALRAQGFDEVIEWHILIRIGRETDGTRPS